MGRSLKKFAAKASDSKSKSSQIKIVECVDCCFAWQWPLTRSRKESAIYFEEKYQEKEEDSYFDQKTRIEVSKLQLKFLEDSVSKGSKNLLDIGAGDGTFIKIAAEHGWNALGIEPARIEFYFDNSNSIGSADMICGNISDLPKEKKFDDITMWDVIEHLDKPIELLKDVLKYLKDAGLLIIETGNYQSADRIVKRNEWWCYALDHRWYFSPSVLKSILINFGFNSVVVSSKTLRPSWNPDAAYIHPSLVKVAKSVIKKPFQISSHIKGYYDLKRAWKEWPQWVRNGIITISAIRDL